MEIDAKIVKLYELIERSNNIVALTGAGISVPSGIPDFRSDNGLYATATGAHDGAYMLSHTCYRLETESFYKFYKDKIIHTDAKPNLAHQFLAHLENIGKLKAIITQNIDGLHTAAGNENVVEFHGTIYDNYCENCGKHYDLDYVVSHEGVPHCDKCGGVVRPNVVLYEEGLNEDNIARSIDAISHADLMLIIGTSLVVYPAAGLVNYFRGGNLVLINKGNTGYDSKADLVINDDVIRVVEGLLTLKHNR